MNCATFSAANALWLVNSQPPNPMLLLAAILCLIAAFVCLHIEKDPRMWYIGRHLMAGSGFFVALALVCAAWWAWQLVP